MTTPARLPYNGLQPLRRLASRQLGWAVIPRDEQLCSWQEI